VEGQGEGKGERPQDAKVGTGMRLCGIDRGRMNYVGYGRWGMRN
jgi:hypothetical protein